MNVMMCQFCRFWDCFFDPAEDEKGVGMGCCVRHAPSPCSGKETDDVLEVVTIWPRTRGDEFCGEFRTREGGE
jgi:hypothetical protein